MGLDGPWLPNARFDIADFGDLVGDPSRAAMLLSLMDGLARPASELARIAQVTPSTASSHLARLREGGLVQVEARGRHRYFRLANDDVAHAIEIIATRAMARPRAARERIADPARDPARAALAAARTCYRHLAGELGVAWLASLEKLELLRLRDGAAVLSPRGIARFDRLGLSIGDRTAGKACLDWTERRPHLGGPLGVLLTQHLFSLAWLARRKDGRALRVTERGRAGFAEFGLSRLSSGA